MPCKVGTVARARRSVWWSFAADRPGRWGAKGHVYAGRRRRDGRWERQRWETKIKWGDAGQRDSPWGRGSMVCRMHACLASICVQMSGDNFDGRETWERRRRRRRVWARSGQAAWLSSRRVGLQRVLAWAATPLQLQPTGDSPAQAQTGGPAQLQLCSSPVNFVNYEWYTAEYKNVCVADNIFQEDLEQTVCEQPSV